MKYDLDEIRDKINIVELSRKLGIDCKDSMDFHMQCPVHNEKTPSFHVYQQAQRFHCFGCGESGDVFDFYKIATGEQNNSKAYADVAGMCGVGEIAQDRLMPPRNSKVKRHESEPDECHAKAIKKAHDCSVIPDPLPDKLNEFMDRKGWTSFTIMELLSDRSIMFDSTGKMIYIYPNGMKIRNDYESSREDRWLIGGVKGNIWRSENCDGKLVKRVWITEGESDLITLKEYRPELMSDAYIAFAGASGRLTQTEAYRIGADREVYLLLDNDKAGHACEMEARAMFKAEGSYVYTIDWDRITIENGKTFNDLGDLPKKVMENIDTYMMGV